VVIKRRATVLILISSLERILLWKGSAEALLIDMQSCTALDPLAVFSRNPLLWKDLGGFTPFIHNPKAGIMIPKHSLHM